MPQPYDRDPTLDSLCEELKVQLSSLNDLYHPVYPADPRRIAGLEALIGDLKESILARRRQLAAVKAPGPTPAPSIP